MRMRNVFNKSVLEIKYLSIKFNAIYALNDCSRLRKRRLLLAYLTFYRLFNKPGMDNCAVSA
jgi:hypothetical protein